MGYNDIYKNNKVVSLYDETASGTFKFTDKSPQIIGKFIRTEIYKKSLLSKKSIMYTFDTDNGERTFFLGGATDNIIRNTLVPGQIYSILLLGKKKTSKGREMNNFRIQHIMDIPKSPEEKAKVVRRRRSSSRKQNTIKTTTQVEQEGSIENGKVNTPST